MGGVGGLCLGMVVVAGCVVYGGGFVTSCVYVCRGFLFCIFIFMDFLMLF